MNNILLTTLAILPGLLISFWIFRADKYDREPVVHLLICFVLGMVSTIPAIALEQYAQSLGLNEDGSMWEVFVFAMLGVALIEEACKYVFLFVYPYRRSFFNEPMDGIVYMVLIGMGFATLENIFYAQEYGIQTVIVRAFTAVPAHAAFAVIMGYYAGLAKFDSKNRFWLFFLGLFLATLLHGMYDFFLMQNDYPSLMGFALVALWIGIRYARRMIKLHQQSSPFKEVEEEDIWDVL